MVPDARPPQAQPGARPPATRATGPSSPTCTTCCVRGGAAAGPDPLESMAVTLAALRSAETGAAVDLSARLSAQPGRRTRNSGSTNPWLLHSTCRRTCSGV